MKHLQRIRRLEHRTQPTLSKAEQERRLAAFVEVETMVFGRPPSVEEIEAEQLRLAQPVRTPSPVKLKQIADEVQKIIEGKPPRKEKL